MNQLRKIILTALALGLAAGAAFAALGDLQKLLDPRVASCWVEGQNLGDMVVGARARINFVYVDRKLGSFIRNSGGETSIPEWLKWHSREYDRHKGKTLFAVQLETFKPMAFDVTQLSIAGHAIAVEDVITKEGFRPEGELPSNFTAEISVIVPSELVKPGSKIAVGYGEYSAKMTLPK